VNGQVLRVNGRALQLMSHPAVIAPPVERETWTAHDVASTFDAVFRSRLPPPGMALMDPRFEGVEAPRAPVTYMFVPD